jgi:hypothetical protein
MERNDLSLPLAATLLLLAGCVTPALAPGASDVKIVRNAADVAACTAVGNFRQPPGEFVDPRNEIVGLGGNTLFVTEQTIGIAAGPRTIVSGVAYHCPIPDSRVRCAPALAANGELKCESFVARKRSVASG